MQTGLFSIVQKFLGTIGMKLRGSASFCVERLCNWERERFPSGKNQWKEREKRHAIG